MIIVKLYEFNLLYQHSLILKLVLGCVSESLVGRIQTGHMDLPTPHVCVRSWKGCRFL